MARKNRKNVEPRWTIRTRTGAIWGQAFSEADASAYAAQIGGTFYRAQ
jgi:hypothetical protein